MARGRSGRPVQVGRAAFTAGTWALGIAIGVALGGWLTVTSGSGAPGATALDVGRDLVLIPVLSGALVFVVVFCAIVLFSVVSRPRASSDVHDA